MQYFNAPRPLGKHPLARGSRGVKHRDFRVIMREAKGKKQHGN
jgi:hypothetical protein